MTETINCPYCGFRFTLAEIVMNFVGELIRWQCPCCFADIKPPDTNTHEETQ